MTPENTHHRSTRAYALLPVLCGALSLLGCDQPAPKCTVGRGAFSAVYKLVSGTGDCAQLKGEVLLIQGYNAKGDRRPDPDKVSIAIQPQGVADLLGAGREPVDADSSDTPYAMGEFASDEANGSDYCVVPELTPAKFDAAEVPEMADMCPPVPAVPATSVSYDFSNVRIYNKASALGTKFFADLTYTKDGCTAVYKVSAVYPSVSCAAAVEEPPQEEPPAEDVEAGVDDVDGGMQEDGGCAPEPEEEEGPAPEPPMADESLCLSSADPYAGRPVGSGINPDFAIRCDPDLLLCVLNEEPPPE